MFFLRLTLRRKSKQAMRDYKKVQIQLENLETSVRDRCKKEFTGTDKPLDITLASVSIPLNQTEPSFTLCSIRPHDRDDGHVQ